MYIYISIHIYLYDRIRTFPWDAAGRRVIIVIRVWSNRAMIMMMIMMWDIESNKMKYVLSPIDTWRIWILWTRMTEMKDILAYNDGISSVSITMNEWTKKRWWWWGGEHCSFFSSSCRTTDLMYIHISEKKCHRELIHSLSLDWKVSKGYFFIWK